MFDVTVIAKTATKINVSYWGLVRAVGFVFTVAGLFSLLASVVVLFSQVFNFLREEHWEAKSFLLALPDAQVAWLISVGNSAGIALELVDFLYWLPLSLAAFLGGVTALLLGMMLSK
jgi:uncharacterized membrane protein required for colicin V production